MGDDERGQERSFLDTSEFVPRRGWAQHPIVLLAMVGAIVGLLYLSYRSSVGGGDGVAATDDAAQGSEEAIESQSVSSEQLEDTAEDQAAEDAGDDTSSNEDAEADDSEASTALPTPDGAFVAATVNLDAAPGNGLVVLSGRVPDQETAQAVTQAAEVSYAPFVESTLEVDESLEPAPWLAAAPAVIGLIPSVTDGTIMVADQKILVAARSPNPGYLANLEGALGFLGQGMPVEVVEAEITDLEPPLFAVAVEDNTMTLSGYVPSEEIISLLAGGAVAAYGSDNVINELTVDPGTYRSFWMQTIPGIFQLFRLFPNYEFTVDQGQFSGSIRSGIGFAADSDEITPEAAQALDIGVGVLARDITVGMAVTGHTDASGPEDYNQALSLARAQSVVDYFVAAGIDAARLVANGAGELEPVAPNDTPEGRAQNRRVEFEFRPAITG